MVAICGKKEIAIECDGERWHSGEEKIREDMERQSTLERLGWKFIRIRGSEYYRGKSKAIERVIQELDQAGIKPETCTNFDDPTEEDHLLMKVKTKAAQLLQNMDGTDDPLLPPPEPDRKKETPSPPLAVNPTPLTQTIHSKPEILKPASKESNKPRRRRVPESLKIQEPKQLTMPLPDDDLLAALKLAGLSCIDNRKETGVLWVIYDPNKEQAFNSLSKRYSFTYTFERRGAVKTQGRPAWFVRAK